MKSTKAVSGISRCYPVFRCVIMLSIMLCTVGPAFAKPLPPRELDGIFDLFSRLETSLSSRKWESASADAANIQQRFVALYPELKKGPSQDVIFQFSTVIDDLKSGIAKKNQAGCITSLTAVQSLFVRVMDMFEYKNPPVLALIDRNLTEGQAEFEGGRYDGVVREMQEIVVLLGHANRHLKERGSLPSDIDEFRIAVISVKMAAEVRDRTETGNGLGKIAGLWKRLYKAV